jgi:hypothetical protein
MWLSLAEQLANSVLCDPSTADEQDIVSSRKHTGVMHFRRRAYLYW